jgi:hypothetical protein
MKQESPGMTVSYRSAWILASTSRRGFESSGLLRNAMYTEMEEMSKDTDKFYPSLSDIELVSPSHLTYVGDRRCPWFSWYFRAVFHKRIHAHSSVSSRMAEASLVTCSGSTHDFSSMTQRSSGPGTCQRQEPMKNLVSFLIAPEFESLDLNPHC